MTGDSFLTKIAIVEKPAALRAIQAKARPGRSVARCGDEDFEKDM